MSYIGIGKLDTLPKQTGEKTAKKTPEFHARPHELPVSHVRSANKRAQKTQGKSLTQLNAELEESSEEGQLSVDILHKEDEMVVVCPIAGVEKSEIRVSLQDDVLTIRGERKNIEELALHTPIVKELFWGAFSRSIILPDHIDRKGIKARVHEHMLLVTIPKTEDYRARVIHVNA